MQILLLLILSMLFNLVNIIYFYSRKWPKHTKEGLTFMQDKRFDCGKSHLIELA